MASCHTSMRCGGQMWRRQDGMLRQLLLTKVRSKQALEVAAAVERQPQKPL